MSKSIVEKFLDFKKRHCLSNSDIEKMMTDYARSELEYASSHFSAKYNISKSVFYKVRDYAVICCLIDEDTCKALKRKTIENYKRNNPMQTANGPVDHFSELRVQRQEFINSFSDNDIKDIGFKYAEGVSIKNIAIAYDTGEYCIKLLLRKGIIMLIIDSKTTKAIELKLGNSLDEILKSREANKQKIIDCLKKEIESLNFKIENYDLYFRFEKEKSTKEELQKKVAELTRKKQEILRY